MKHYLLNHQPQNGLQAACAHQGQAPTCNARGKGRTSASPKTLTKVILVLLTMFLLPNAAWGEETTYTFNGTTLSAPTGTATSNITNGGSYSWDIKNFYRTYYGENTSYTGGSVTPTTTTLGFTVSSSENITTSFHLVSSAGMTGTFVSATINYTLSNVSAAKVQVLKEDNNSYAPLSYGDENYGYTALSVSGSSATLQLSESHTENKILNNNKICFSFSFDSNNNNASITINSITITTTETIYLTVAGIPVTSANANNITGDNITLANGGKVSFTPAEGSNSAKLTLNNATLKVSTDGGAAIESTLDNLIVYLVGDNAVQAVGSQVSNIYAFKGNNKNTITFQTNVQEPGKIQGLVSEQSVFNAVTPAYQEGLVLTRDGNNFEIGAIKYGLTIGGTVVTALNADDILGDDKVSFKPATVGADQESTPATLTLNGATINGMIWTSLKNLSIKLQGANKINVTSTGDNNSGANGIVTTSEVTGKTLTITKETGATLEISSTASAIRGFNALVHDGLYIETKVPYTSNETYVLSDKTANMDSIGVKWLKLSETETYPLWVGGVQATASNSGSGISSSGVTFNSEESTLTLNKATISGAIYSTIGSLNVYLKSSSTITLPEGSTTAEPSFKFVGTAEQGETVSLTFRSTDDEAGDLTMDGTLTKNNSGSSVTLTIGGYSVTNQFDDGTGTNLTGEWIYNSPSGKHHIFRNKLYGLWVGSYQVTRANKSSISSGYPTFDEDNLALRLTGRYTDITIKSAMPALKLFVKGECSLKSIIFDTTYNPDSEAGTLTIEKDPDPNDPATNNSLSLSNTDGGVITGFSNVTVEAPLHVLDPIGQSVWDSSVTSAEISDWTWSGVEEIFEDNNTYATYYNPEADMYLPSGYTPYVITGVSGSSVTTQALSYIPMGAMVLIAKSENTATTAVTTGNMLKYADSGNPVTATETSNYYVLYNGKFVKVTRGTTIGGLDSRSRCYLDLSGVTVAGTRGFYDIDGGDGTTGIREVKSEGVKGEKLADGAWHDLQGRRLSAKPTKPGLYILNGKKVVIK